MKLLKPADPNNEQLLALTLQELMHKARLTEAELSRRTSLPQATLHKIITGKTPDPRISTLKILADFFQISVEALMAGNSNFQDNNAVPLPKSIPIISWSDCLKGMVYFNTLSPNHWRQWIVADSATDNSFALISKPSMAARFSKEAILIVDPDLEPIDGDLVIIHYQGTPEATIREVLIDGPTRLLLPITPGASSEPLDNHKKILGVVIQSRFNYHHKNI